MLKCVRHTSNTFSLKTPKSKKTTKTFTENSSGRFGYKFVSSLNNRIVPGAGIRKRHYHASNVIHAFPNNLRKSEFKNFDTSNKRRDTVFDTGCVQERQNAVAHQARDACHLLVLLKSQIRLYIHVLYVIFTFPEFKTISRNSLLLTKFRDSKLYSLVTAH